MHHPRSHTPDPAPADPAPADPAPADNGRWQGPVSAHARVPTERGERYGKQLCGHAAWKASRAQWTPPDGVIEFPGSTGVCRITAEPDCLLLAVDAATPADLVRLQQIVGGNIERFGAREDLTVTWTDGPGHGATNGG
ncbi:DUF2218 domain-containing protein [Streptacidiphilus sp. N1-10]|uniref:DUF2218 domain-containing protein n=1 Tax=Streptacidiphilus jeojiensis TaxID=3229225 RepID=A0ABV6XNS0_9ACTN